MIEQSACKKRENVAYMRNCRMPLLERTFGLSRELRSLNLFPLRLDVSAAL